MSSSVQTFYQGFRDPNTIQFLAKQIQQLSAELTAPFAIMEVCGGHTHTIMRYGLQQLLPENIEFIHGPGCPVCVMPKERIDQAIALAQQPNTILLTLGDMIRVPGSKMSLEKARAAGADVRALYSPLDAITIAKQNPDKQVIFFAIGFETTTPMSAAVLEKSIALKLSNLFFHINHILVPPAVEAVLSQPKHRVQALIAPSHVSVITGANIYLPFAEQHGLPVVVSGFEPVDVMQSIVWLLKQRIEQQAKVEIEYSRAVSWQGNQAAQQLISRYFEARNSFRWRGLGDIPNSALQLKDAFAQWDAEQVFKAQLPWQPIDDHKLCICGDILCGMAKPQDCKVFGKGCDPSRPLGSCMVSSEGACHAYYKYGKIAEVSIDSVKSKASKNG